MFKDHTGATHTAQNDPTISSFDIPTNLQRQHIEHSQSDVAATAPSLSSDIYQYQYDGRGGYGAELASPWDLHDPTVGFVRRATIVIPVEITLNGRTDDDHRIIDDDCEGVDMLLSDNPDPVISEIADDGNGLVETCIDKITRNEHRGGYAQCVNARELNTFTPTYLIRRSKLTLYTAFPPPPIILSNTSNNHRAKNQLNVHELNNAKQRLKRFSGFHGAVGVTSATCQEEGYVDTILSMNYRFPTMMTLPNLAHRFQMMGNMHCNLILGANTKSSLGGSLYSLDGKQSLCMDVLSPFDRSQNESLENILTGNRILSPLDGRNINISASRDFFVGMHPFRIQWLMKLSPLSPQNRATSGNEANFRPNTSHLQKFTLLLANLNHNLDRSEPKEATRNVFSTDIPKISLSFDCGRDNNFWYHFPQSGLFLPDIDITRSRKVGITSRFSTSLRLDVDQQLSPSQQCHSFFHYCYFGQLLSVGIMSTRNFSSSRFSRLGVGVRHVFENIWERKLWKQGKTFWVLQLERGGASFCIPITILPNALTTVDSIVRLVYASLASIVVDAIVGELLCGATSFLRVQFLQFVLGKARNEEGWRYIDRDIKQEQQINEKLSFEQLKIKIRHDALKQRNLMVKHASANSKKEEGRNGLVILRAIYGVIDNNSRDWLYSNADMNRAAEYSALDVTTQLQFWVVDSTLQMPATSKKHLLGFYNVIDFVDKEAWVPKNEALPVNTNIEKTTSNFIQSIYHWFKKIFDGPDEHLKHSRDLAAVLSIRYMWEGKLFDVMFYDNEAVMLPTSRAREVTVPDVTSTTLHAYPQ